MGHGDCHVRYCCRRCLSSGGRCAARGGMSGQPPTHRVALQNYEDRYGSFPPAYVLNAQGQRWHSWRVLLLPDLVTRTYTTSTASTNLGTARTTANCWRKCGRLGVRLTGNGPRDHELLRDRRTTDGLPEHCALSLKHVTDGTSNTPVDRKRGCGNRLARTSRLELRGLEKRGLSFQPAPLAAHTEQVRFLFLDESSEFNRNIPEKLSAPFAHCRGRPSRV